MSSGTLRAKCVDPMGPLAATSAPAASTGAARMVVARSARRARRKGNLVGMDDCMIVFVVGLRWEGECR